MIFFEAVIDFRIMRGWGAQPLRPHRLRRPKGGARARKVKMGLPPPGAGTVGRAKFASVGGFGGADREGSRAGDYGGSEAV